MHALSACKVRVQPLTCKIMATDIQQR